MKDTPNAKATSDEHGMPAFHRSRKRAYNGSEVAGKGWVSIGGLDGRRRFHQSN
jgi:hypothetical protein